MLFLYPPPRLLSHSGVPYTKPVMPLQLSAEQDRFKFGVIYANYGGGVFSFANEQFEKINGCSNDYHGWGAEDDDLYWRLRVRFACVQCSCVLMVCVV